MPRLLQVAQLGHPILRKTAQKVEEVGSVQEIIDDMMATCEDIDGVGISAPQVYISLQIFIMASKPNSQYPNAPFMKPTVIMNPSISVHGDRKKDWEGCLSIPGLRGQVARPYLVTATFLNRDGISCKETFEGFLARIFLHEYDHLQGTLFVDRADPKDLATDKEYMRLIQKTIPAVQPEPKKELAPFMTTPPTCPNCDSPTIRNGACWRCMACGSFGRS